MHSAHVRAINTLFHNNNISKLCNEPYSINDSDLQYTCVSTDTCKIYLHIIITTPNHADAKKIAPRLSDADALFPYVFSGSAQPVSELLCTQLKIDGRQRLYRPA